MLELNSIYNEECLCGMAKLESKSIDMILCDLPYGTTNCPWDSIIPFDKLWEQYERIIKDNGAIVLTASQPFTTALIMSNLKLFRYEWIWKKGKHTTGFQSANKRPLKNHENICVFYKKSPVYNPQGLLKIPLQKVKAKKHVAGILEGATGLLKDYERSYTNYPKSVLDIPRDSNTKHPTQKPLRLFEYLILTYTCKNDVVLDNCMGSGTTAIACINTQRNFVGFELDINFYHYALSRIHDTLHGYKQFSLFDNEYF